MKYFLWDDEKNAWLKQERGVSFEDVSFCIENGNVLDIIEHPNPKYCGQRIFIVEIDNYAYRVPFIETEKEVILKTVIPSRKDTRFYLGKGGHENEKED